MDPKRRPTAAEVMAHVWLNPPSDAKAITSSVSTDDLPQGGVSSSPMGLPAPRRKGVSLSSL